MMRSLHGVVVKMLDYGIIVSEFKLHLLYYIRFQTSTFQKGARGVVVIVVGNEHGDSRSNPGRD